MVDPEVLIFVIGAIITVIGSFVAARYAGRASVKVAEVSADEGAYVRAQEIYEKTIAQLEASGKRLEDENKRLRTRVLRLEKRVAELEQGLTPAASHEDYELEEDGT